MPHLRTIAMTSTADYSKVSIVTVDECYQGQRIDNFLLARLKGVPKSRLYRLLRKGEVRVNKKRIKPEYRLQPNDAIRLPPIKVNTVVVGDLTPKLATLLASSVLYEDESLIVFNKPTGLAVHGGSGVSLGLIEAVRQWRKQPSLELVHRLDRDTSGCIIIAKKRSMLRYLQDCFRAGSVDKVYRALVVGPWPKRVFKVNKPLIKNQAANGGDRIVKIATNEMAGAKASVTEFSILKEFKEATLIQAKPITGRTHQIRVHCASVGCSIVGDDKYTLSEHNKYFREKGAKRLFLHSFSIGIGLPNGENLAVSAPLDERWHSLMDQLSPVV